MSGKCRYREVCEDCHPLLSVCNQSWVNEWCVQYVSFEEARGNAPYFTLKSLGRLKHDNAVKTEEKRR